MEPMRMEPMRMIEKKSTELRGCGVRGRSRIRWRKGMKMFNIQCQRINIIFFEKKAIQTKLTNPNEIIKENKVIREKVSKKRETKKHQKLS